MNKVYCYPRCTTCKKAVKWLEENGIDYEYKHIVEETPSKEDIKKYYSLPDRTLGRFARKKLSAKSKEAEIKAFDEEIDWVRKLLGDNYLEKLLEKVGDAENEIIIAIENQNYDS